MLTAIHKETDKVLYAPDLPPEEGVDLKKKKLIVDPYTLNPCTYVHKSEKARSHFRMRHKLTPEEYETYFVPDSDCFHFDKDGKVSVSESPDHHQSKIWLRDFYQAKYPSEEICFEQRILMPCGRWRIADVAIGVPDGLNLVVEAQLSPIPIKDLTCRVSDYNLMGINSIWWLGQKLRTPDVMNYLALNSEYAFLNITKTTVSTEHE